jgi:hypothetical protein
MKRTHEWAARLEEQFGALFKGIENSPCWEARSSVFRIAGLKGGIRNER